MMASSRAGLAPALSDPERPHCMSGTHIAALFETTASAHAAQAGLIAAGVDASRILVLDRGHHETPEAHGLWAVLKHLFIPDDDAHDYAEGVFRGHPLVIADITDSEQDAALAALEAAHPVDIETRTQEWRDDGWNGIYDADAIALAANPSFRGAESSEGDISPNDVLTGDYGSVGAPFDARIDTSILRGKTIGGGDHTAVRTDDGDLVRVYSVE
jgi:hypothetical protein